MKQYEYSWKQIGFFDDEGNAIKSMADKGWELVTCVYFESNLEPLVRYYFKREVDNTLTERELLYKILFELRKDVTELKKFVYDGQNISYTPENIPTNERTIIEQAIKKHSGRRKLIAKELGISERTLYRKMKEYNL